MNQLNLKMLYRTHYNNYYIAVFIYTKEINRKYIRYTQAEMPYSHPSYEATFNLNLFWPFLILIIFYLFICFFPYF
jgi:hypothetical protein